MEGCTLLLATSLFVGACGQRLEPVAVDSAPEQEAAVVVEEASAPPVATPTSAPAASPAVSSAPPQMPPATTAQAEPRQRGWVAIPPVPFAASFSHTAWTGDELLVLGGATTDQGLHREAAAYDPTRMTWRTLAPPPHGVWRHWGEAHWTGREVIIFGVDHSASDPGSSPRLAYDPSTDRWRELPAAPLRDVAFSASTWTGRELVVLATPRSGGAPVGAAYDPSTDRWRTIAPFPLEGDRFAPSTVWTGEELLVWGGSQEQGSLDGGEPPSPPEGGAAYDPTRDQWRVLDVAAPALGLRPTAWTGHEILALAGDDPMQVHAISPDFRSVRQLADAPTAAMRGENPVWTGSELVLIGGRSETARPAAVAFYLRANSWRELPDPGFRSERAQVISWAGSELIVVGGRSTVVMETERHEGDAFSWRP